MLSHPKHSTALQPNVFLTEIHRLLLTSKGRSTFPSANNFQGQLQTPQSISVAYSANLLQPFWYRHCYGHFVYMQTENFGQLKVQINYRGEKINPLRNTDAGNVIKSCIVKSNYNRGISHVLHTTPPYFHYIALSELKPSGAEAKSLQPLTQSRCFMLLSQ
jgi:hypothetical protein